MAYQVSATGRKAQGDRDLEAASAYLFVYGTLKRSFQNRWARLLRRSSIYAGAGRTRGLLFRVSHFPALVRRNGRDWVTGEVYRLHAPESLFRRLDIYEGSAYRRVSVRVTVKGRAVRAFTYEWRRPVTGLSRIESGQFEPDSLTA